MASAYDNWLDVHELRRRLHYDPATGDLTWKIRPNGRVPAGSVAGHVRRDGYVVVSIQKKQVLAHRLAWLHVHGEWTAGQIDHADGNPANNRIANLRACSQPENLQNQVLRRDSTSGFTGATYHRGKWEARIQSEGVMHYLGAYDTPEAAGEAYSAAKAEIHSFNPVQRAA